MIVEEKYSVLRELKLRHEMNLTPEKTFLNFAKDLCRLDFERLSNFQIEKSLIMEIRSLMNSIVFHEIKRAITEEKRNHKAGHFWFYKQDLIISYLAPTYLNIYVGDIYQIHFLEDKYSRIILKAIEEVGLDIE